MYKINKYKNLKYVLPRTKKYLLVLENLYIPKFFDRQTLMLQLLLI